MFGKYTKAIVALAGAAISWGVLVLTSTNPGITGGEVASGLILLGGVIGVKQFANAE